MGEVSCRTEVEEGVSDKVWEVGERSWESKDQRWQLDLLRGALVSSAVLRGSRGPKPCHMGLRTSAPRQGLDLFFAVSLVSKMVPGIQEVLRRYRSDGWMDGWTEVRKSGWCVERASEGGGREKSGGRRAGSCRLSCLVASISSWNWEAK